MRLQAGRAAVASLMEQGIKPMSTATRLVKEHGEERCLGWIDALPFCNFENAAGYLIAALDTHRDLPLAYIAAREKGAEQIEQGAKQKRKAQHRFQAAETVRREREEADRRWESLTLAKQEEIKGRESAVILQRYGKQVNSGKKWLASLMGQQELHLRCLDALMRDNKSTMDKAA